MSSEQSEQIRDSDKKCRNIKLNFGIDMKQKKSQHHGLVGLKDYTNEKSVSSEQSKQIRDSDKWEIKKLGEVCELSAGGDVPKDYFSEIQTEKYQIPIYANGEKNDGLYGYTTIAKIVKPSITVSARGTIGFSIKRLEPFFPIVRLIVVSPIDLKKLSLDFLDYALRKIDFKHSGSSIPQLTVPMIRDYEIPLPPLPEQQRIVSILDKAFAAIDKAKANAEQNLKNAKELFESYLQGVFENLFQEKEKKKISEVAKVIGGYSFKSTDFKNQGKYQVLRMGNIRPAMIRENESPVFIDTTDEKLLSKALLQINDVIITQTGTKNKRDYGFTVIIEKGNYLLNQRIASIRFSEKYLPKFFLYFSWTNIFKDQYFANETGTVGQGNVGIGAITEALVPFISKKAQQTIVRQLDALRAETQKLEAVYQKKIADLEELKKSILQKAFAGELRGGEPAEPKTEKAIAV